jgi:hypothetical protein
VILVRAGDGQVRAFHNICRHRGNKLVWTNTAGRKSLVLGCAAGRVFVRQWEWATQPDFAYRHRWSVGDLAIWDNTGTMHRATPYRPNSGRLLTRTKLEGEEPLV